MIPDLVGSPDPTARDELLRLLMPIRDDLAELAAHPPAVSPEDWLGPASRACETREVELRGRLLHALVEVEAALAEGRGAP